MANRYLPPPKELDRIMDKPHAPGYYVIARLHGVIHGGELIKDKNKHDPIGILKNFFGECDEFIIVELDARGKWWYT